MNNVIDIDDKLFEKNPAAIEFNNLYEEICEYLPVNLISNEVISYSCRKFLYDKTLKFDWMDKVDCYLGLPDYVKTEEDLSQVKYKKFPLSLVFKIALYSMNEFKFSLFDENSIKGDNSFFHFNFSDFYDHNDEFEAGLENNLQGWANKVTLKWKSLMKKIRDNPYKYPQERISVQLSHYWHAKIKDNLKKSIINTIIREWLDYSTRQDYGLWEHYKKRGEFEDMVDAIQYFDIPQIYNIYEENDGTSSYEFNALFPTVQSFGEEVLRFYTTSKVLLENDPSNHIIQEEIEFIELLISNSKKRFLKKIGYDLSLIK